MKLSMMVKIYSLETEMLRKLTILIISIFALSACITTQDPYTGEQKVSKTAIGAGVGALVGGIGGALMGDGSKDKRKKALIGAGIGALSGGAIGYYMDRQAAILRERLRNSGVSVTRVGNDIILNMPSNITFASDRSQLSPRFNEVLNSVAIVQNEFKKTYINVDGHTDSSGSDSHNMDLSSRRANIVAQYLMSRQVHPQRFRVQGYGETTPIASNATEEGKALNRRVELRLIPII